MKTTWRIEGEMAKRLSKFRMLVFGPGPRKWTFDLPSPYDGTWNVDHVEPGPVWVLTR